MTHTKPIPALGEKHHTSTVFIISKENPKKVLLIHHKKLSVWLPPGGHEELYENSVETAIREVREETGLDVSDCFNPPIQFGDHVRALPTPRFVLEEKIPAYGDQPEHYHLDSVYVIEVPWREVINNKQESHGIGWFTIGDARTLDLLGLFQNPLKTAETNKLLSPARRGRRH